MISYMRVLSIAVGFLLFPVLASGYNRLHGPFDPKTHPTRFPLLQCKEVHREDRGNLRPDLAVFADVGRNRTSALVHVSFDRASAQASFIVTDASGLIIHGPENIGDTVPWGGLESVSTADLNADGRPDYVISVWMGGCGLASGYHCMAFVLSTPGGYKTRIVTTLNPDESDFLNIDGACKFIHTSFIHGNEGRDGKAHNYWVYNLYEFAEGEMRIANHLLFDFPKWISHTFKENHKPTTQLTGEQKYRLWRAIAPK